MRYLEVDTVSFTDALGNVYPVKELREIPSYETRIILNKNAGDFLDEVASRAEALGEGYEAESYLLWEANAQEIADVEFDLSKIRSVKVPQT